MRQSKNEIGPMGFVMNGFDYAIQVWVEDGIIQNCGHPENEKNCCKARQMNGCWIGHADGHSVQEGA